MANKENVSLGRLFARLMVMFFIALVLLAGVPVLGIFLWAAHLDAKHDRQEPQVEQNAISYLEQQYPGHDFEITSLGHNFKDNTFDVKVQSRGSMDTHFTLKFRDDTLELETDTYEWAVVNRGNVRERIVEAYKARTKQALKDLPGVSLILPDFMVYKENSGNDLYFSPMGLDTQTLKLDGIYDAAAMGNDYGYLELWFTEEPEDIHLEHLAQRFRQVDGALTQAGIGYRVMNIKLRTPEGEIKLYVFDVLREDIRAENFPERLRELWEAQEAKRQERQKESNSQ